MPIKYSPDGQIVGCTADSIADAKICIKEIKLKKKEFQLQKKEVAAQIAQVRAAHRTANINRGPAVRGSGGLAKVLRTMDKATKQTAAINTNNAISQLETRKNAFDQKIAQLDGAILSLERYILDKSSA